MSARNILFGIFAVVLGLAWPTQAADRDCPGCYQALDTREVHSEAKRLKNSAVTPKDFNKPSTQIRHVDVITIPDPSKNGIAAGQRPHPQGDLRLKRVVEIVGQ